MDDGRDQEEYIRQVLEAYRVRQLDLAPFDTLIWPHLGLNLPAAADASS